LQDDRLLILLVTLNGYIKNQYWVLWSN